MEVCSPLVYIEWFTPIGLPDPTTCMHIVKWSTRLHKRKAEIISINNVVSSCHLMAKCGTQIDQSYTTDDVLEKATTFYLNPYIDVDTFSKIK